MKTKLVVLGLAFIFTFAVGIHLEASTNLENLQEGQKIHGFKVMNVYENAAGKAMGARFVSDRYGFIIDLLQIQSVPQAFF